MKLNLGTKEQDILDRFVSRCNLSPDEVIAAALQTLEQASRLKPRRGAIYEHGSAGESGRSYHRLDALFDVVPG